ncbi:transmembrane emp24 domain-containing protein 3-like [Venturia canescens]|uniref:transmembrane emp24 domain-containing protein 3-like n=1 Tax=Venturia canescens TaxID=32260 RepID=UPI001C9CC4C4|nr:transmembrane emp24 domain-containing protein 3-like [Venturia canescens]
MDYWRPLLLFFSLFSGALSKGIELSFELADNAKECFYEEVDKNVTCSLGFQVITGGQYDIDITIEAPNKEIIHQLVKAQSDSHEFITTLSGVYKVCFSNEFSTFSHKLVYMDFQCGEELALPGTKDHITVLTQMETSAQAIHEHMVRIVDYQTFHRLREAQGRKRAEDLNERVLWWSIMETAAILVITVGQVLVLKNFFTERKPFQRL